MLNLPNASYDMAGMYVCVIEASDLPELQRNNSVLVTVIGKWLEKCVCVCVCVSGRGCGGGIYSLPFIF